MDIKYLFVKQYVKKCGVDVQYISTELLIADLMTKGLPADQYKKHVDNMEHVSSFKL